MLQRDNKPVTTFYRSASFLLNEPGSKVMVLIKGGVNDLVQVLCNHQGHSKVLLSACFSQSTQLHMMIVFRHPILVRQWNDENCGVFHSVGKFILRIPQTNFSVLFQSSIGRGKDTEKSESMPSPFLSLCTLSFRVLVIHFLFPSSQPFTFSHINGNCWWPP